MFLETKRFNIQITTRGKDVLLVVLWTAIISLIMIKAHIILFQGPLGWRIYNPPTLGLLDMLILTVMSVVATIVFSDIKPIVYGFASSLCLSFIIAVTYASLFVWYDMGMGRVAQSAYDWEWAIYSGFWHMFFLMIPWVIGTSTIGLAMGILIRVWTKTS